MSVIQCPACLGMNVGGPLHRLTIERAAEYFIPKARSRGRHDALLAILRGLWKGADVVEIRRCLDCGFGFALPFVAGNIAFYEVAFQGASPYPKDRWEFRRTLDALTKLRWSSDTTNLLEAGAGDGNFLHGLRENSVGKRFRMTALEYDHGALRRLRAAGFEAVAGSFIDLAQELNQRGRFDCICFFQTLEHMDRIDEHFDAIGRLGTRDVHVFVSAPYGPSVDAEERAVGFTEMPPHHIGRWDLPSIKIVAGRHGFQVAEWELEPQWPRARDAWLLARNRTNISTTDPSSFEGRIQAISFRPARGVVKRLVAVGWLPMMWRLAKTMLGHNQWVHLVKA
jgi:hypothetical protein